jgi:enoyl-[acyl-carrier protein] reductase II
MKTRITELFDIRYPIIQAGMIWCSGWRLAAAVSEAGGLGLIGAGSMYPDVLKEHIQKTKAATKKPFGVNIPLLYPEIDKIVEIVLKEKIKIVFTSAGNPKTWTPIFKEHGIKVVHVVASSKFAIKAQDAGVDAVVAEGFEAGGHNGIEETTTLVLIPIIRKAVDLPLIAAGGIGTGRQMLATFALGAEGVQVGSRFVVSTESSAHPIFKQKIIEAKEGDTQLTLKRLLPVRLIKNKFYNEINEMQASGATIEQLKAHLGKGRANLVNACLEIENIQFCYVSSVSTLGLTKQDETLNETNCWKESRGNSLYAISKYVAEREVWRATKEGLKAFIVNPSIILGPGDWKTDSSQLIAKVAKGISFYTEGVMGFVDVRDVAEIMVLLMDVEMKNERFIISSENLSYKELFKIITDTFEKKKPSFKLSPCILQLAWHICYPMTLFGFQPLITKEIANSASKQIFYDNTKIKNFLNYQFIPIKKSVADIGKIFIENQQKS